MVIEIAREHARAACRRDANIFGPSFFDEHLAVVADVAARLAPEVGADVEAVVAAAYLHDLSAVCDAATLPTHAAASAEIAREFLSGRGFMGSMIEGVARAIASHSEPLAAGSASPEEICLSNADAAARMLRPAYWLYFAFAVRKLPFDEGRDWLRSLYQRQWAALIEPARELVERHSGRSNSSTALPNCCAVYGF